MTASERVTREIRRRAREGRVSLKRISTETGIPYNTLQRRVSAHGWKWHEVMAVSRVLGCTATDIALAIEAAPMD